MKCLCRLTESPGHADWHSGLYTIKDRGRELTPGNGGAQKKGTQGQRSTSDQTTGKDVDVDMLSSG